ncbi:MAG: HlyC/CorC family transporter [Lachnospiraceae bacterium]|nr:HlyC/CorC family transporter [Lachnospiraceae bacterium]
MDDGGPNSGIILIVLIVLVAVDIALRMWGKISAVLKARKEAQAAAEENILSMVNESHEQGYIEASEAEMISNIFEFGDKQAQDIMTDRSNIIAMEAEMTLNDALNFMLNESNSRFPVYKENLDHIIGIIYLKDAFRVARNRSLLDMPIGEVEGLLRSAHFIPETRNVDDLFKTMRATKLQMVMVIDEYGQTSGLVALEDILEEIVGNIMDEYDEDEGYIEQKANNKYIIDGMTPLEELEERFDISFGEVPVETLNGYLISKMERIPTEKDRFSINVEGYNFKVIEVENKMIKKVVVAKQQPDINKKDENPKENDK